MKARVRSAAAFLIVLAVAGCGGGRPSPSASAPTVSSPSPSGDVSAPALVTFDVAGQGTFTVELLTQALVDHSAALRDGTTQGGGIPMGTIVEGNGGVNAPWHWHLDPTTFEFVDAATEVCDGLPSYVEDKTLTSPYYCPWAAKVIGIASR